LDQLDKQVDYLLKSKTAKLPVAEFIERTFRASC